MQDKRNYKQCHGLLQRHVRVMRRRAYGHVVQHRHHTNPSAQALWCHAEGYQHD